MTSFFSLRKKVLVGAIMVALFALNWAALHDILKGEPDVTAEYTIVIGSIALLGVVALAKVVRAKKV